MALTSQRPLHVGLLGFGVAGAVFHAPLVEATSGLRLRFVVTSSPERAQQAREQYPHAELLSRADELFARAGELDLVVVATPNRSHAELTGRVLEAGLPVVVDKPFTPTAAEGRELIAEAARRGLPLTVFQNRRWDNDMRTLRGILERGDLGGVHRFESRFERWVPVPKQGWRESGAAAEAGGVLYDLGSHLIDQALQLFGPASSVYAEMDRRRSGVEVDDDAFVAVKHGSGVRSHLWMGKIAADHGPRFRVLGDRAAYTKYGLDPQEGALREGAKPGDDGWGEEPEECWGRLGTVEANRRIRTEPGGYELFYQGVRDALRDGSALPVDPADAVAALEVIEAARRSAERSAVVPVSGAADG